MGCKHICWYIVVVSGVLLCCCVEASIRNLSFNKKSIEEKPKPRNPIKSKFVKIATVTAINGNTTEFDDATTGSTLNVIPDEDNIKLETDFISTTPMNNNIAPLATSTEVPKVTSNLNTQKSSHNTVDDISCTCGIFLGSQFVKGSTAQPKGDAVISNTIDRSFPCNPIGQRQCQTKCLEQIVQHLPNSANLLCASLDRDIQKERAFLFVKNCSNKWHNTNLAAGREYCCKDSLPYKCSK